MEEPILMETVGKNEFSVDGNKATFTGTSTRAPRSLEELIQVMNVDMTVWKVDKWKAIIRDQAAMPRSVRQPDTGKWWRDSTEPITTALYQINAEFVKIKPEPVLYPQVQPIHIEVPAEFRDAPLEPDSEVLRAMIVPDIQTGFKFDHRTRALIPFHDRRALDVALQIARATQPDIIVFNGDDVDLNEWSDKYIKSPEFYWTTQPAIAECGWWKFQFRLACPKARIYWLEGNHEARLALAVVKHNVASYDLRPWDDLDGPAALSIANLCGTARMGIEYVGPYPHGIVWLNENFAVEHGWIVRGESGKTVAKALEDARHSMNQGHIHRVEMAAKTVWGHDGPRTYMASSFGTMARIDPNVVPAYKSRNNWQQAFGEVEVEPGNGFYNARPVLIFDGATIYNGRRWKGRPELEIVENIESDLKGFKVH